MLNTLSDKLKSLDVETLPYRRQMSKEEVAKLKDVCMMGFGENIHPGVIEKVMNYCYYIERHMKGRAAGHVEDLILRYLFRYYASLMPVSDDPQYCHMEIGVLFGAATISAHHATRLAEKKFPIVVVEPFEGYYGQDVDPNTKIPVSEQIFSENLDRFQIPRDDVVIVKGFSTDPAIVEKCSQWKVLSLLIDGDHSYSGVANDWLHFSRFVVPGGFVLIDDYNNRSWPDINRFVNYDLLPNLHGEWRVSLSYGRSIILQKTGTTHKTYTSEETARIQKMLDLEKRLQETTIGFERLSRETREASDVSEVVMDELQKKVSDLQSRNDTLVAESKKSIEVLQGKVSELQASANDLQRRNAMLEQDSKKLMKEYADKIAQVNREFSAEIAKQRDQLGEERTRMEEAKNEHKRVVDQLESRVREEHKKYLETRNHLRVILNSLSWRLLTPLRKIKELILPGWRAK